MARTVLIVDDCRTNRALLRELLAEVDCGIIEAADGLEALQTVRAQRPGLVVMDIEMPHLDGLRATAALRADPACAGTRVLVLSGDGSETTREAARHAGCDGFLAKPLRRDQFLATVRGLLGDADP